MKRIAGTVNSYQTLSMRSAVLAAVVLALGCGAVPEEQEAEKANDIAQQTAELVSYFADFDGESPRVTTRAAATTDGLK